MAVFPDRPTNLKLFEPTNPEYVLADEMAAEVFWNVSPNLIWWTFDSATTTEYMRDDLDLVYGENSSEGKNIYLDPKRVYGYFEINPILQEITRMGVDQIEEINIFINVNDYKLRTGLDKPNSGDVFRMDFIDLSTNTSKRNFYTVGTVTPTDLFEFKYLTWQIYAEQTNMTNIPDAIKDFTDLPEDPHHYTDL